MQFKTIAAAAALAVGLAAPAFAQTMTTTTTETTRSFAAPEREVITKYYTTHRDLLAAPGTTTVTTVTRGQPLPTTVTVRELPSDLVTQLPPISTPNYRRVLVGNQVVLVDNNNMVIDVLPLGG